MSAGGTSPSAPSVRIAAKSGRVKVVAENRDDVVVEGRARVEEAQGRTTIDGGSDRLLVRVPEGADLVLGTSSGRVDVSGRLGAVAITTNSGRVGVEHATTVDIRASTGRIDVGRVEGHARIRNRSGRVTVRHAGEADVATKSGRIDLPSVAGPATAHCVSGRIQIGLDDVADVDAETVSGRIRIRIPRAARPHLVDGPPPTDPAPPDCDCTVATRTVSGRVTVEQR